MIKLKSIKKLLKIFLVIIVLAITGIVIKSCVKKSSSLCSGCESKYDAVIPVTFEKSLGNLCLNTEVYYSHVTKNECEIGIANSADREKFVKISSKLAMLLNLVFPFDEKTIAFTIYRNGALHKDSAVLPKEIVGISRYYTKNNKLFHQFFVKSEIENTFSELTDLHAEVDGIIFNYMHLIGLSILNMKQPATAFFLKTVEAKGLYATLKKPHDDLGWKLKIYMLKKGLGTTNNPTNYILVNCIHSIPMKYRSDHDS